MLCPKCGIGNTKVNGTIKSYSVDRYRECKDCGYKFTTTEKICEIMASALETANNTAETCSLVPQSLILGQMPTMGCTDNLKDNSWR